MSEFLLELGSTSAQRASLSGVDLADTWLAANDFGSRLGAVYHEMRGPHARMAGVFPGISSLAEAWAKINRIPVAQAIAQIQQADRAYSMIGSPATLDAIYSTLGARIRSGHYDDRDWEGYLDLADAKLNMKFDLISRPGADDRIRMGERPQLKFELISSPGGDDRIQLSGGFMKKIGKGLGGAVKKIGKVAKKVLPIAAAAVATYFTGGAAAPLLTAAIGNAVGGKKKKTPEQEVAITYTADMVATTQTLEQAGVEVPPNMSEFAAAGASALQSAPGGQQALTDSFRVIKSGVGDDPEMAKAIQAAEAQATGSFPTWGYAAIGGGVVGLGLVALVVKKLLDAPRHSTA